MSYLVLARKWRPQSFADLVGQGHVSQTLANAIATDRVAHAFLFTGVRGVGKTTSARILAKALNCEKGPTAEPCQTCSACREITAGSDVDVQEIDGASYTGVDDVRKLQESLPYRPQRDRFKIFIVDEVHMLSNNAWNALLKTLEEPPPHVKFIFATTEVHKVPVTILSRCQRYDFKLIGAQTIAKRLAQVLSAEGVPADEAALALLARQAAGSMRDAMSLLDQVIAWSAGEALTAEVVARVLGVAGRASLHRLAASVVGGDAAGALRIVADLAEQGLDMPVVARDLLVHLRDLVVAKVSPDASLTELTDAELREVKDLVASASTDDLVRLHQGFSRGYDDIVRGGQVRAALEMALVRLARRPALVPVGELLARLAELEARLGGGGRPPSGGGGGGARPPRAQEPPQRGGPPPTRSADPAPPPRAAAEDPRVEQKPSSPPPAPPPVASEPPSLAAPALASPGNAPGGATPAPSLEVGSAPAEPAAAAEALPPPPRAPERPRLGPAKTFVAPTFTQPDAARAPHAQPPPRPTPAEAAKPLVTHGDVDAWRALTEAVAASSPQLAETLRLSFLERFGAERVELTIPTPFLASRLDEPGARAALRGALASHFGREPEVILKTSERSAGVSLSKLEHAARRSADDAARKRVLEHPLVRVAIAKLDAEVRDVRLPTAG